MFLPSPANDSSTRFARTGSEAVKIEREGSVEIEAGIKKKRARLKKKKCPTNKTLSLVISA